MPNYRLISADSHVSEPPDLWVTRVDKKYRERAPRLAVVKDPAPLAGLTESDARICLYRPISEKIRAVG